MILAIIVFLLIPVVALIANAVEDHNKSISFDAVYEEAGLPIITLKNNGADFNFLVDTGANLNVLNESCLDTLDYEPLEGTGTMFGMEGNIQEVTYVKVALTHGRKKFEAAFQVVNIDNAFGRIEKDYNVTIHGVLGTSFLEKYKGKINFEERSLKYGKENKVKNKRQDK